MKTAKNRDICEELSSQNENVNDRHMETETRTALQSGAFTTSIQAEETMRFPDPR